MNELIEALEMVKTRVCPMDGASCNDLYEDEIAAAQSLISQQEQRITELEAENVRLQGDAFSAYGDLACLPEWGMDKYLERAKSAHDTLAKLFEDYPAWTEASDEPTDV